MILSKKLLPILLVLALLFTLFSPVCQAAGEEEASLPASFDLRSVDTDGDGVGDRCYVTPVKAQYPFGTCWGFASVAAAETSILGSLLEDDPEAWKTLDLSEKHLAYFSHIHVDDPSSSQNGEGMYPVEYKNAEDIYGGGSVFLAANTFGAGIGPVLESRGETYEYHGREKKVTEKAVLHGVAFDFPFYAIEDDWNLPEADRYLQDYILKESYILPNPTTATFDMESMTSSYTYSEEVTQAIKKQLIQKRAVSVGFHADTSRPWQFDVPGEYMNVATWAHYTWDSSLPNHAVTIVGWDDHFAASNFLEGHQPEHDGAWLCKNSWGSGTNEFPNKGMGNWGIQTEKTDENGNPVTDENGNPVMVGSGYFWISYYDHSLSNPECFIFETFWNHPEAKWPFNGTVYRHQYDLMPASSVSPLSAEEEMKAANIFTADQAEQLAYISYEVGIANSEISWALYLLSPGYKTPEDGVLLRSGRRSCEYGGFYIQELVPLVTLQSGQTYSIVISQNAGGQYLVEAPSGHGKNSAFITQMPPEAGLTLTEYAVAVVNPGESMIYHKGAWQDWLGAETAYEVLGDDSSIDLLKAVDAQFDNFSLKAFGIDKINDLDLALDYSGDTLILNAGEESELLSIVFSGSQLETVNPSWLTVSWDLPENGKEIAQVIPQTEAEGQASLQAKVKAVAPGKTYLFVTAVGAGTVILPVEVH